jgi:putative Holliday junction resolvase
VDARQAFIDGGMKKRKRQEKGRVDEMAARLLLQEYLESKSHR